MSERKRRRKRSSASKRAKGSDRARIETSAGGVVFRRTDDALLYLLIRDPYDNWGLPKGHIESGESPEQASVREVIEETGLTVSVLAELPKIDWYFRDQETLVHKFCHFFLMEAPEGEAVPQIDEGITACVWLPFDEALRTLSYANARDVLRAAARSLEGSDDAVSGVGA